MGKIESESRRRARKGEIQKLVLEVIKVAGIATVAIVAPNVIGAMEKLGLIATRRQRELIGRSIDRMYAQGLLRHSRGGLRLTESGEKRLRSLQLQMFNVRKSRSWDRKWRVLIFDIPEERRKLRDDIRRTLLGNGFIRLQNSVWVYPYDCEDWVNLWKAELHVGKELLYLIVDSIEGDFVLKRGFAL